MRQKIKIMTHKQHPSDEEIRSFMNFDDLLEKRKAAATRMRVKSIAKWSVPAILMTATVVWFIYQNDSRHYVAQGDGSGQRPSERMDSVTKKIQPTDETMVTTVPSDSVKPEKKPQENTPLNKEQELAEARPRQSKPRKVERIDSATPKVETSDYKQAEPVSGYSDLYQYFNSNLVYPSEALKDSIQGVQTISFVINAEGKAEQIQIVTSLGEPFEKEARRLIDNMPAWNPATLNGKPVASKVSLPLTFQIQKVKR
jgi:TonB family protein